MPAQYPVRLYSGGTIVSAGLTMSGKTLKAGSVDGLVVSEGGMAEAFAVSAGGFAVVFDGEVRDFQLFGKYAGGEASRGELRVFSGGLAQDTTINSCGALTVQCDGLASQVTILSQGELRSYDGNDSSVLALDHLGSGAALVERVEGGLLQGCTSGLEFVGFAVLGSGGTMQDCKVLNGGRLNVSGGAVISTGISGSATFFGGIMSAGEVASNATVTASSGTVLIGVALNGNADTYENGTLVLHSGVAASGLFVNRGGFVSAVDTDFTGLTVRSGGIAKISSGCVLGGSLQIESGGQLTITSNTVIDFTVAGQTPENEALINAWNRISGRTKADYTLTLAAGQAAGTYLLANDAGAFNKAVTVQTADDPSVCTLTVNGGVSVGSDWFHQLSCSDGVLSYSCSSALVDNLQATATKDGLLFTWDAVEGAPWYQLTLDNGSNWIGCNTTSFLYTGTYATFARVRVTDGTNAGTATEELVTARSADATDVCGLVSASDPGATITLQSGNYTGTGPVNLKAGQTLTGQGSSKTSVEKAIYAGGNSVTIRDLAAATNVAGGAVNEAADQTDLNVESALLKDAFAGALVNSGSVAVASAGADFAATTFRNVYGAGYVTGEATLTNDEIELNVSGGCSTTGGSGCIFGAGRAANGATLSAGSVRVQVDNGNSAYLGGLGLYAGGYANGGSQLAVTSTDVAIKSGVFTKFVAAGEQVYGSNTSGTLASATLAISDGEFNNAVLGASYAANGATAAVTGKATTTISGGIYHTYVVGGGYANGGTLTVNAVDLTISGGKFIRYIFGGNLCSDAEHTTTEVTGQVHLTLDASTRKIEAAAIYAGSFLGTVGSTQVELTGVGGNLSFSHIYGSNANPTTTGVGVTGTKEIKFTDFSGELSGKLYQFDTLTMTGSTVKFKNGQDLTDIKVWDLDLTGTGVSATNALINWGNGGTNDFSGDTLNLAFDTALEAGTSLLVIDGDSSTDLALDKDGLQVNFNGLAANYDSTAKSWSLDGWTLGNAGNDLVLSKAALA